MASFKMVPKEEIIGKVTDGHTTNSGLGRAEKSEIGDFSRSAATYTPQIPW